MIQCYQGKPQSHMRVYMYHCIYCQRVRTIRDDECAGPTTRLHHSHYAGSVNLLPALQSSPAAPLNTIAMGHFSCLIPKKVLHTLKSLSIMFSRDLHILVPSGKNPPTCSGTLINTSTIAGFETNGRLLRDKKISLLVKATYARLRNRILATVTKVY